MKRINVFVLTIFFILLSACSTQTPTSYISSELGIDIPKAEETTYNDAHDGFNGDGTAFGTIKLGSDNAKIFCTELSENDNWLRHG